MTVKNAESLLCEILSKPNKTDNSVEIIQQQYLLSTAEVHAKL